MCSQHGTESVPVSQPFVVGYSRLLGNHFAGTSEAAPAGDSAIAPTSGILAVRPARDAVVDGREPGNANKPMILRAVGSLRCGFADPR